MAFAFVCNYPNVAAMNLSPLGRKERDSLASSEPLVQTMHMELTQMKTKVDDLLSSVTHIFVIIHLGMMRHIFLREVTGYNHLQWKHKIISSSQRKSPSEKVDSSINRNGHIALTAVV